MPLYALQVFCNLSPKSDMKVWKWNFAAANAIFSYAKDYFIVTVFSVIVRWVTCACFLFLTFIFPPPSFILDTRNQKLDSFLKHVNTLNNCTRPDQGYHPLLHYHFPSLKSPNKLGPTPIRFQNLWTLPGFDINVEWHTKLK